MAAAICTFVGVLLTIFGLPLVWPSIIGLLVLLITFVTLYNDSTRSKPFAATLDALAQMTVGAICMLFVADTAGSIFGKKK